MSCLRCAVHRALLSVQAGKWRSRAYKEALSQRRRQKVSVVEAEAESGEGRGRVVACAAGDSWLWRC